LGKIVTLKKTAVLAVFSLESPLLLVLKLIILRRLIISHYPLRHTQQLYEKKTNSTESRKRWRKFHF